MNLTAGTTLQNGKYLLGNVLGQGKLCTTLQATQAYLNQAVVLKTLRSDSQTSADSAQLRQQFIEDARRFAQCQHPGLVRVVDLFVETGLPFAAMDYVAGQSLASLVQAYGPLSEAQAIQYIRQAGSALSVIHRNGLVHRDVNPQNLIRPQGTDFVVLVDFGIIHQTMSVGEGSAVTEDCYAAIEQFQSQAKLSAATDIYALAGTLYFLTTGQKPMGATLRDHTLLPPPRKLQPKLSSATESAILSGLEVNSQSRPHTIAAWFALLPSSETLPPVSEFPTPQGHPSPSVQLPPASANSNGSKATSPVPQPAPQATRVVSPSPSVSPAAAQLEKNRFPKAIVATALISAMLGLGVGVVLRLSAASGIGPRIFHTQQSFPPLNDWPGSAEPAAAPVAPLPPPPTVRQNPEPLPPVRPKPVPPVISSPSPSPQPTPQLTGEPFPSPTSGVSSTPSPLPNPLPPETISPQPNPSSSPLTPASPEPSPDVKPKEGT
jgi:serine/threonine-protein kinase